MSEEQFAILFVCHANLCRSPLAEFLARRALDDAVGAAAATVTVGSAGTHAYPGSPMHPASATVLAEIGTDAPGFRTRRVDERLLNAADLVLTAGREQRSKCVDLAPAALGRTFTLRQFARLVAAVPAGPALVSGPPPQRLHALVDQVRSHRHLAPTAPPARDELDDPVGKPVEEFRACAESIWASLSAMVRVIGGS